VRAAPISHLAKVTLFALFWANLLNFLDRQVIAALAPFLKSTWQLSDTQVGLLATAFEVTYALSPVPIALLGDRWLRRRVVALALAIWSGAMALAGAAGSFTVMLLGRAGLGLGQAGYGPSALAWLSDLFPPSHRSRAVSIHDLALMLGSAAGYALGGVLGKALGWRPVFWLAALPGFLLALAIWSLPEPPKGQSDYQALGMERTVDARPPPFPSALRELLTTPTLIVTYAAGVLVNLATAGLIYWLPSFAVRLHGLSEGTAGLVIGALTVVTGAAGVLSGGFVADRLLRRTPAGRLLTFGLSYTVGFPLALAAVFASNTVLFLALAILAVYLFTFYFPCLAPLVHQVTRPELRATAMGIGLFVVHILGNAVAPTLVGWLSDQMGDLRLGLASALLAALLGAFIALWGTRFVGRDTQAMLNHLQINQGPGRPE
jgi:MFS transporter, Spinster family, sphingosine-1-phosphate transporter